MKLTIGVMGASGGKLSEEVRQKAYHLGEAVAERDAILTGGGFMGREITNIRSCDMVVIVGGRTGTLGELAIAYDEGRLIGILKGTGGITQIVEEAMRAV